MHTLPIIGPDGTLRLRLEALGLPALLDAARRIFDAMDGGAEFDRHGGSISVTREELLAALRVPPNTTTHVNLCVVQPDALEASCSHHHTKTRPRSRGRTNRPCSAST